jgi:hypothetical protein
MPNVNLSPYTAESEAIANRMRMAQLIGQQSMQPMEMPQQPGAKFSPYQGLAKMMQAYVSVLGQEKALEQQKELQNKIGTEATDWIANYSSGIKGTPNTPEQTYKPGEADYREMGMMGKDLQVNPQGMAVEPAQAGIPTRARTPEEQQAYLGQGMRNPLTSAMASALLSKNIENQNFQNILKSAGMGNAPTAPMGGASAAPTGGMQPIGGGITGNINPNILAMSGDPRAIELAKYLSGQNKIKNFEVEIINKVPTRVGLTESGNKIIIGPVEQALSPDTAARLKQEKEISDRAFTQLSAKDKADLADKAIGRNISAQQLFFDTGIRVGGGTFVNPLAQPTNAPPAQPAPNAPRPAGALTPTSAPVNAPVAGAPVANAPPTSTSPYTPFSNLNAQANDLVLPPKLRFEQMKNAPTQENTLRDEFNTLTRDFRTVQDAHSKIKSVANTGAGDMSLLYSYVKLLDPGSVVRESEFATAAASGSFGERIQGLAQRVISGQRLPPDLRTDFIREADGIYTSQKEGADRLEKQYRDIAKRGNLNPENVIVNYASSSGTALPPVNTLKEGQVTTFGNGQQWTLKNGKQVQVK